MTPEDRLPVFQLSSPSKLDELFALPFDRLGKGWLGAKSGVNVEFIVAIDSSKLYFGAQANAKPDVMQLNSGTFTEGLWDKDVAELFIKLPGDHSYFELNLSPTGAWWLAWFFNYRERAAAHDFSSTEIECYSSIQKNSWQCAISLPLSALSLTDRSFAAVEGNVCAIVGSNPRNYFTWAAPVGDSPDFHKAELFCPVELNISFPLH